MQSVTRARLIIGLVFLAALRTSASATQDRITILYDAFGKSSGMKKDWGYSALVEYGGKHILFDTGNNAEIFAQNVSRGLISRSSISRSSHTGTGITPVA